MSKNNSKGKKKNLTFTSINRFIIVQFVLMIILSIFITTSVSNIAKDNAKQHLAAVTDQRAQLTIDHIKNAETILNSFSKAPQVAELLKDENDADLIKAAQYYNTVFAEELENVEGLYIANWDAKTLTHSNQNTVGVVIREGDRLEELHKALEEAGKSVYVSGVLISPSSQQPVISMYRAVYDSGKPIGFVGMAIEANSLITKLENMKTPGLEKSFYSMIDVKDRVYVFDSEDSESPCQPLVIPDLVSKCDEFAEVNTVEAETYEFNRPDGKFVGSSYYIPQYHWLLMMNDTRKEVYTLAYAMRMFLIVFSALLLAMMLLFTYLNKRQDQVKRKLLSSVEQFNETKKSLNTAMFGDVLTDVGNRIKLATDLMNITDGKTNPYYFAMFNIMEFSNINTAYGSDTGDALLVRTAQTLKDTFKNGQVYRTGSDEFVVAIRSENGMPRNNDVLADIDKALKQLIEPETIQGIGTLYPNFKISSIKKTIDIDAAVITILKEMTNSDGVAMVGQINFVDMSE
jgi:GGDEF domain-containing protein